MKIANINKFLPPLVALLCTFTYLLNFFNKIFQCSLVFIFMALITNVIAELYSRKISMGSLVFSAVVSFGLLWNFDYYIHGNIVSGIVFASLVAVLLSLYCSTNIFLHLKSTYSFNNRNFISLITCAVIDAIVMSGFFINKFPLDKVISIFSKEILFKVLYSLVIYGIISFGAHFIKKTSISNRV